MKNDAVIKSEGLRILAENLGIVEAERFVALLLREPFDYTDWQRNLYKGETVSSLFEKVRAFEKTRPAALEHRHEQHHDPAGQTTGRF